MADHSPSNSPPWTNAYERWLVYQQGLWLWHLGRLSELLGLPLTLEHLSTWSQPRSTETLVCINSNRK
jgi:hypothetical protein